MFPVTAAFATQGYYAQADMLDQLFFFGFDKFAIIAYVVAVVGALVMLVLGAPSKNYLWFIMGPAIFHWMVGTPYLTHGVQWGVGYLEGPDITNLNPSLNQLRVRDQRRVWDLARVGLSSSNFVVRAGITVPGPGTTAPAPTGGFLGGTPLFGQARVADLFAYFDHIISDTSQQIIHWLAPHYLSQSSGGLNLFNADLISNLKWDKLETITSARVQNLDLADAFTHFLASECGDELMNKIDQKKFSLATESRGRDLIRLISPGLSLPPVWSRYSALQEGVLGNGLTGAIPPPEPLKNILRRALTTSPGYGLPYPNSPNDDASFENQAMINNVFGPPSAGFATVYNTFVQQALIVVDCDSYFKVLMHGLRWEGAKIFMQLVRSRPPEMSEDQFLQTLLHGWHLQAVNGNYIPMNTPAFAFFRRLWVNNLILVHLLRNELKLSSQLPDG